MPDATDLVLEASRVIGPGVIAVFARPGAGKTTLLRSLLLRWPGSRAAVDPEYQMQYSTGRICYLDLLGDDWRDLPRGGLIAIDEVDRLMARGPKEARWVLDLVNMARPWGISVAFSARRPSAVRRDLTACARIMALGQITERLDREYLSAWYPEAETLRSIKEFRFRVIRL